MLEELSQIISIINKSVNAKDTSRVFTFIEFIKEYGYDNDANTFLNLYNEYVIEWNKVKKEFENSIKSDKDIIRESLIETLKTIVISYSSYEEQDFIANIDWTNEEHKKAIIPFFASKIKKVCDFYKHKRNEAHLIVNKNSLRGTKKSIEEIVYDKIIDFYFDNKELRPSISELQKNLNVSLEQYVDVYSDYFDIPRHKKPSDESRVEMLSANMNDVDYKDYLEIDKTISEILYPNEVYLIEIPLVAESILDLSAACVGDKLDLREKLISEATVNRIALSDQIALKRRLYEKFLGCDLYYIYCDENKNVTFDILTKADNPSGNLLNASRADTATTESEQLKLLSQIGLFFKPEKTSILKVSADNFTWQIDESKLIADSFYVFPDPTKYGDIGANKDANYPLVMEYKLDSNIKNLSSGAAKDDPMNYICNVTWNSYYTKQDEDYKLIDNKDFKYSFTSLMNIGLLTNYQRDIYGNEYGLIVKPSSSDFLPKLHKVPGGTSQETTTNNKKHLLLNGGYFIDPRYRNKKDKNGEKVLQEFPYDEKIRINDTYNWSGIKLNEDYSINYPTLFSQEINIGNFSSHQGITYEDHYNTKLNALTDKESYSEIADINDSKFKTEAIGLETYDITPYGLYYKSADSLSSPLEIIETEIKNFHIINDLLIIEGDTISFYKIEASGDRNKLEINNIDDDYKNSYLYKMLYSEKHNSLYFLIIKETNDAKFNVIIYEMNLSNYNFRTLTFEDESSFECNRRVTKIEDVAFSFNNELNLFLISYVEIDGAANLYCYEHLFKIYNDSELITDIESRVYCPVKEGLKRVLLFIKSPNSEYAERKTFSIEENEFKVTKESSTSNPLK